MQLVIHLPAGNDLSAPCAWTLLSDAGQLLRHDVSTLDSIPRAERIWVIVPAGRVLFAELVLPPVSQSRLDELLPFAVEDKLMSDPAAIVAVAGPARADRQRVVAVTDKAWLSAALTTLQRVGLQPDVVLPTSALVAREAGTWHAVISPGQREGVLVREDGFAVAFDYSAGQDAPLTLQLTLKEAAKRGSGPAQLALIGAEGADAAAWSQQLGLPVAMRSADAQALPAGRQAFDFLTSPALRNFAKRSNWREAITLLRPAAVVVALLLVLHLGLLAADTWRLNREKQALETAMVDVFKSAFPEARAVVDAPLQMRRNLEALQRERGTGGSAFAATVGRIATQVEASAGVNVRSLKYAREGTVVEVEADDAAKLNQIGPHRPTPLAGSPPRARFSVGSSQ